MGLNQADSKTIPGLHTESTSGVHRHACAGGLQECSSESMGGRGRSSTKRDRKANGLDNHVLKSLVSSQQSKPMKGSALSLEVFKRSLPPKEQRYDKSIYVRDTALLWENPTFSPKLTGYQGDNLLLESGIIWKVTFLVTTWCTEHGGCGSMGIKS